MSTKNPLTPVGIEPANFRFVARHPNHCDTAVPYHAQRLYKLTCIEFTKCRVRYRIKTGVQGRSLPLPTLLTSSSVPVATKERNRPKPRMKFKAGGNVTRQGE